MKVTYTKWVLSTKVRGGRILVPHPAWGWCSGNMAIGVRLFHTREDARKAQEECCYSRTQVDKVQVIIETC